jgi:hypothetical protein
MHVMLPGIVRIFFRRRRQDVIVRHLGEPLDAAAIDGGESAGRRFPPEG